MLKSIYIIVLLLLFSQNSTAAKRSNTISQPVAVSQTKAAEQEFYKKKAENKESENKEEAKTNNEAISEKIDASSSVAQDQQAKEIVAINNSVFNNSSVVKKVIEYSSSTDSDNTLLSQSYSTALVLATSKSLASTSALSTAKSNVSIYQSALETAKTAVDTANTNLVAAESSASAAMKTYETTGDSSTLKSALLALTAAQTAATTAQSNLTTAQSNLTTAQTSLTALVATAKSDQSALETALTNSSNNPLSNSATQAANELNANSQISSSKSYISQSTTVQSLATQTQSNATTSQTNLTNELSDTQTIINNLNSDIAKSEIGSIVSLATSSSSSSTSATSISALSTQVAKGGISKLSVGLTKTETLTPIYTNTDVANLLKYNTDISLQASIWSSSLTTTTPTGSVAALASDGQPSIGLNQVNTTNYLALGAVKYNNVNTQTVESNLASINNNQVTFSKELLSYLGVEVDSSTGEITSINLGAYQTLTNQSGDGWVSATDNPLIGKNIYEFAIQSGKFQELLTLRPIGDVSTGDPSLTTKYTGTQEQVENAANAQLLVSQDFMKDSWTRYLAFALSSVYAGSSSNVYSDLKTNLIGKTIVIADQLNDVYKTGSDTYSFTLNAGGLLAFGYIKGYGAAGSYVTALDYAYNASGSTVYFNIVNSYYVKADEGCDITASDCIAITYDSSTGTFTQNHDTYNYSAANPTPEMYMAVHGSINSSITVSDVESDSYLNWENKCVYVNGGGSSTNCGSYTAISTTATTTNYDSTAGYTASSTSGSSTSYFKATTTSTTKSGTTLDLSAVSSDLVAVLDSNTSVVKLGSGDNSVYIEQYLYSSSPIKYSNDVSYDFYLNASPTDGSSFLFSGSSSDLRSLSQIHLNSTTTNITLTSMSNYYNSSDLSSDKAYLISPYQYGSTLTVTDDGKTYTFEYDIEGNYNYTSQQQSDVTLLSFIVSSLSGSTSQAITDAHLIEITQTTGDDTITIDNKSSYVTITGNGGNDVIDLTSASGSTSDQVIRITDFNSGDEIKLAGTSTITQLDTGLGTYNQLTGSTTHDYVITTVDGSYEDRIYITSDHALSITNNIVS